MKKNIFMLTMLALASFGFTACDNDDEKDNNNENVNIVYNKPAYVDETVKLELNQPVNLTLNDKALILSEVELTESGNYFAKVRNVENEGEGAVKTRAIEDFFYLFGNFEKTGTYSYNLFGFAAITLTDISATQCTITLTLADGTKYTAVAAITSSGISIGQIASANLCRTWTIKSTRVEVSGANGFYQQAGFKVNEIIDYVKQHAEIDDEFEANQNVTDIIFTSNGTIAIVYENGNIDMGSWKWDDMANGSFAYSWESEDMGFSFANGKGTVSYSADYCQVKLYGMTNNQREITFTLNMVP